MLDDPEPNEEGVEPGTFAPDFNQSSIPAGQHRIGLSGLSVPHTGEIDFSMYGGSNPLFSHFEPMLDTDPFGLSASMHFRTPFSYEQSNIRQ